MTDHIIPILREVDLRFHPRDKLSLERMASKGFIVMACKICEHNCFWRNGDDLCCYCRGALPRPALKKTGIISL